MTAHLIVGNRWWDLPKSHHAVEAWERITYGGLKILAIVEALPSAVPPWGIYHFREPTAPDGGLRLISWDDAAETKSQTCIRVIEPGRLIDCG